MFFDCLPVIATRQGGEMAPSACGEGYRGERAPGGDACGQPCFYPTQSSGGGGDLRSRERWVFPTLREFADGGLHALRGSTGLLPLRRSAAARSSRAPNVLRHLTKQGQARRRHLTTTAARRTVTSRITLRTTRGSCRSVFQA